MGWRKGRAVLVPPKRQPQALEALAERTCRGVLALVLGLCPQGAPSASVGPSGGGLHGGARTPQHHPDGGSEGGLQGEALGRGGASPLSLTLSLPCAQDS